MSAFIIKQEFQCDYYEVDGCKYISTFPYEWAIDHKWHHEYKDCGSGPKECENCREYGSINGVFVLYCANCKDYIYDTLPGPKRSGLASGYLSTEEIKTDEELWQQAPYMVGISLSQIREPKVEVEQVAETAQQMELTQTASSRYWEHYFAFENPASQEWPEEWAKEWGRPVFWSNSPKVVDDVPPLKEYEEEEYEEEEYEREDFEDDLEHEAYDDENPITHYELSRLPRAMREAFNPKYKMCLADFKTCMYDE